MYAAEEAYRNLKEEVLRNRLSHLLNTVRIVPEARELRLSPTIHLREKDVPILTAAVAAKATHLITGDNKDFGSFYGKKTSGVLILPPVEYFNSK